MEKIALYRKYRPADFNNFYGQKTVVQTLMNAIKHNRISHAYIFSGNKGSGKTSMAKIFSKAINCLHPINDNPCNTCENCVAINNNLCMDVIELDAASNSGINEIKNVIESVVFMPSQLKYKVYIIDEAHMLTNNSWNALLKTLEEPPAHAILIFATTEYQKIPATIVSRCQRYDFNKIPRDLLNTLITTVADKENIKITPQAIHAISLLANGAARDALSILDQLANFANDAIDLKLINEMFGLLDINAKINYLNVILGNDIEQALSMINQYNQGGINFNVLIYEIVQIMMDKMIYLLTKNAMLLQILDAESVQLVNTTNTNKLLELIDLYNGSIAKLKSSEHPKFIFEYISITACNLDSNPAQTIKPNITKTIPATSTTINKYGTQNTNTSVNSSPKPANTIASPSDNIINPIEQANPNIAMSKTPVISPLVMPEISDNLFNTQSRMVIAPAEPEVVKQQTVLFEAVDNTDELLQENNEINNLTNDDLVDLTSGIDIPITNIKLTKKFDLDTKPFLNQTNEKTVPPASSTPSPSQTKKFGTSDYVLRNKDEQNLDLENIYSDEYKQSFFAIANNHDKNTKEEFNKILNELKEIPNLINTNMNAFLNADKFLITSKNGAILLFDEEAQVIRFNKFSLSKTFHEYYHTHFKCEQLVLGVYKLQALGLKKEYQNLVKKEFKDVKINNVFKDEKKTMLLDILNLRDKNENDNNSDVQE